MRDRRQLHWFQRFLEDQEIKKAGKDSHSSGLFTLRSAKLAWKEDKKTNQGESWNANRLILFCTIDTRFWSAEGTQLARKEKEAKLLKTIDNMKDKGELSPTQQAFVQKKKYRKKYSLLNRQRQQKQYLSHLPHKAQKRSANNQKGESNLGEYV